jgi:hypothetical protein
VVLPWFFFLYEIREEAKEIKPCSWASHTDPKPESLVARPVIRFPYSVFPAQRTAVSFVPYHNAEPDVLFVTAKSELNKETFPNSQS